MTLVGGFGRTSGRIQISLQVLAATPDMMERACCFEEQRLNVLNGKDFSVTFVFWISARCDEHPGDNII
jgi:hypothetical protein